MPPPIPTQSFEEIVKSKALPDHVKDRTIWLYHNDRYGEWLSRHAPTSLQSGTQVAQYEKRVFEGTLPAPRAEQETWQALTDQGQQVTWKPKPSAALPGIAGLGQRSLEMAKEREAMGRPTAVRAATKPSIAGLGERSLEMMREPGYEQRMQEFAAGKEGRRQQALMESLLPPETGVTPPPGGPGEGSEGEEEGFPPMAADQGAIVARFKHIVVDGIRYIVALDANGQMLGMPERIGEVAAPPTGPTLPENIQLGKLIKRSDGSEGFYTQDAAGNLDWNEITPPPTREPTYGPVPGGGREGEIVTLPDGSTGYYRRSPYGDWTWQQLTSAGPLEEPVSDYQKEYLGLQRQQLEWEKERERQELAWQKERENLGRQLSEWEKWQMGFQQQQAAQQEALSRSQYEAQLAAQGPASWLELASYRNQAPTVQPWMQALRPELQTGQPVPGARTLSWGIDPRTGVNVPIPQTSYQSMPELPMPSAQFLRQQGPDVREMYLGYEQARTGKTPAQSAYELWLRGAPGGGGRQLTYAR